MEEIEERQPPDVMTSDTDNATKVQPKEAPPSKRAKFRRFRAYNRGTWNGPRRENKEIVRRQDNLQRYDAISSTLELTQSQKNRGREIFDSLDLISLTNKGKEDIDSVVFAICVLVANDDVNDGTRYWPLDTGDSSRPFPEFAKELGLSINDQLSIIKRVQSRSIF